MSGSTPRDLTGATPNDPSPSDRSRDAVVSRAIDDAMLPGVVVEVTPADAELLGSFPESALSAEDAWEANADLDPAEAEGHHGG